MKKMNDKEIKLANRFFEEYDGNRLAEAIGDCLNNCNFSEDDFVYEVSKREDKEKILDTLYLYVYQLKAFSDINWYDVRNKHAVELGKDIYFLLKPEIDEAILKHNFFIPVKIDEHSSKEATFVIAIGRMDRIFLQIFSEVIFKLLMLFPALKQKLCSLGNI